MNYQLYYGDANRKFFLVEMLALKTHAILALVLNYIKLSEIFGWPKSYVTFNQALIVSLCLTRLYIMKMWKGWNWVAAAFFRKFALCPIFGISSLKWDILPDNRLNSQ